jgi:hypothetical protein
MERGNSVTNDGAARLHGAAKSGAASGGSNFRKDKDG